MIGTVRGVIYEKRFLNKDTEYIRDKLYPQGVIKARFIEKSVDGGRRKTPLIVLTFKQETLPKTIKLGSEIKHVKPYIIHPSQCKKC